MQGPANPLLTGTFNYQTGTLTAAGNVTGVGRCTQITVHAFGFDGSFTINGGATVVIRSGTDKTIYPGGNLVAPVITWVSGTLDVLVTGLT
jgi:hypothetical protein